jgi:hypothetical protein
VSFFDEDDEPVRTTPRPRPRPRRGSPAGGAAADQQQIYMRRAVGGLLIVLIVVLLGIVVKGCSDSRAKSALTTYNDKVTAIGSESHGTSNQFFALFKPGQQPSAQELQSSINQLILQSGTTLSQAEKLNVPSEMVPAQQSLLIALQLRQDGLKNIGQNIRTALGDSGEQADAAIKHIQGDMARFNASDVLFQARVDPFIQNTLKEKDIAGSVINSVFLPTVDWMSPEYIATQLDQQLSSGNNGSSASGSQSQQTTGPGLHGMGLNATSAGNQALSASAPNTITYTPGMIFFVSFTNQGDNDEFNVKVTLRIESESSSPITLTGTVQNAPKGVKQTVQLKLNRTPPLNTAASIRVTVAPVPGEKNLTNNKSSYPALFKRG